ncbi:NUDIX domain-containing protein [Streptomyces inhibens]|uniref:NUDIX domain-containing protein n=1 Tax=Streptomyces inhibens TaxID=2293571 RepID=UPI00402A7627
MPGRVRPCPADRKTTEFIAVRAARSARRQLDYREIPGGYVETGESPRQASIREVREELGIEPEIGRLLAVDWAPSPSEGDKVLYIFDGGVLTPELQGQIRLQSAEIRSHNFHPASALADLTIPRLARRVEAAVQARNAGDVVYLEHGKKAPHEV